MTGKAKGDLLMQVAAW